MAQGDIDRVAKQVDKLARGLHANVDPGMLCIEISQPRHQPAGGERRLGADRQRVAAGQHLKVEQCTFDLAEPA